MSLIQGFYEGLRPVRVLKVWEWADANRVLTSESSAEPGRWRTSRTPYLKQIFEDLSPSSPIQKVVVMKGAQLGFSESAINMVGCYMDISPCPIGYVMPTIAIAEQLSKDRLEPMILNCESLNSKVRAKRDRDGGNTTLQKMFPGGRLALMGANSAASLRSRAMRVAALDEVDAYPLDVEGEGSPIQLVAKRLNTFGARKKMFMLSTPTVKGRSVIESEIIETEYQKYHIPCPICGTYQELLFERLRWEPGEFSSVRYECTSCEGLFEERHKPRFLAAGEWVDTYPERRKPFVRGYHMNSLYSPLGWLSWAEIVEEWEKAQKEKDLAKIKTFVNTVLGQSFEEAAERPQWEVLYSRRESYKIGQVPNEVAFLTAGADVQRDRIEIEIVGWCKNKRSYSIDYRVLLGDTSDIPVWDELGKVLNEQFIREDQAAMPLQLMAVDSGYNTVQVYEFTRRFGNNKVVAIKGSDTQDRILSSPLPCNVGRQGKPIPGIKRWVVGVSLLKSELYGWLRQFATDEREPHGYCHFPLYDDRYFKGLVAEKLVTRIDKRGYQQRQWEKEFERNEPLDCRVYARAAAAIFGIDRMEDENYDRLISQYQPIEAVEVQVQKPVVRERHGGYLERRKKFL